MTDKIGTGAFGSVQIAVHRETHKESVVKVIRKSKVLTESWEQNATVSLPKIAGDQYDGMYI